MMAYLMAQEEAALDATVAVVSPRSMFPKVYVSDLKISDKDGNLIPLVWNQEQEAWLREHELDLMDPDIRGLHMRDIILKPRQRGFSTMFAALLFLNICNYPRMRNVTIAHDKETAQAIFEKTHCFYDNLPREKQRPKKFSNKRELHFSDNDSKYFIGTAGTDFFGSGTTLHNVHKTEYAKWQFADPQNLANLNASMDAACLKGNIYVESTANGVNHFEQDYKDARDKRSAYRSRFFAWFQNDEYEKACPKDYVFDGADEAKRQEFRLSRDKMYWYVQTRLEFKELMTQEYPFTDEEAFIASAMVYFDRPKLLELWNHLRSPEYDPRKDIVLHPGQFPLLSECYRNETLEIWHPPKPGRAYIIPADCAQGEDPAGDDVCSGALDTTSHEQCCELYGKWDTETYAKILVELYQWYNFGLVAPERNGMGWNICTALRRLGVPPQRGRGCSGLYHHDQSLITGQKAPKGITLKMGWDTNHISKEYACGELNAALVGGYITINSRRLVAQMLTFMRLPGGELGGAPGKKDDAVSFAWIGAALLSLKFHKMSDQSVPDPRPPQTPYGVRHGWREQGREDDGYE